MRRREETKTVGDTPHLQISIDKPDEDPMMGGMEEPQEEEDPNMYNPEQDAMASDMSAWQAHLVQADLICLKHSVLRQTVSWVAIDHWLLRVSRWRLLGRR